MLEIKGQYNTAKVFTDSLEEAAAAQIRQLCDMEYAADAKIRIMPDVHAGAGCTIGTTMTITDKVVPNLVGVDIGCGMETIRLGSRELDLEKLDGLIHERIPAGMNVREMPHRFSEETELSSLRCFRDIHADWALRSVGTLGGGNHFIEADKDDKGRLYLVVHSGSRYLGNEVAKLYQEKGCARLNGCDKRTVQQLIAAYKEAGRAREIQSALKALKGRAATAIPRELAYVADDLFEDYIHDMRIVQRYAAINRRAIAADILDGMGMEAEEAFTTIHNYIDTDAMILRKGAVSAKKGEQLLIPINMRDGSLLCIGRGNADWNCSAPHGAGRRMSRAAAKKTFTVEEFRRQMTAVYSTSVNGETLDECPMAYKDMAEIVQAITPTAEIVGVIRPVYNFKAGE